ncbi:Cytosine/adenosine deaminase [Variovorax sp. HW608]|uniref:amidohydrolase family protein n=1 Tax=Variovorax sp. HW608 TaxID=1034889 RepID=UPI00081F7A0E|nr:amidohydrolase family protein [Variovorax sp. HW608]SCK37310.1 Cytosine/adenosine deaminase [Variovorax sp. HW608]
MKTLIRNAFVVSVDPTIGNVDGADILVENGRITAVRPDLAQEVDLAACEVVDATGHIASPGFVDTHHHVWQSAVRGITADWSIRDYVSGIRLFVASCYRPEDMYAAQLGGLLQGLREGVTTTADYCHNLNSPDHVEESIRGNQESGARVVWSYGFNRPPLPNPAFTSLQDREDYLRRTASKYFASKDSLLTLAVSPEESWFWADRAYGARQFRVARELDAHIFWHANSTRNIFDGTPRRDVGQLVEEGLLGSDLTLVHMNHSQPDEWHAVADAGAHVSITPETELQMNMGWPVIEETRRHGINVGLGIDILSNNSADLRFQLRLLLQTGRRMLTQAESGKLDKGVPISCAEALHWGTLGGAQALGLGDQIGSLTPGKAADILLHDARGLSMLGWPRSNPEAAILLHGGADTLSTVMVGGRFVKRDHRLTCDEGRAVSLLSSTHDHLLARFEEQGGLAAAMDKPIDRYAGSSDSKEGRVIRV